MTVAAGRPPVMGKSNRSCNRRLRRVEDDAVEVEFEFEFVDVDVMSDSTNSSGMPSVLAILQLQ
jgi:hypothetical protein